MLPKGALPDAGEGSCDPCRAPAHWTRTDKRDTHYGEQRDKHHSPRQAEVSGEEEVGKKGGLVGSRRRGKINQEQSRLMYEPRRGLLRIGGLTAPTSAPTLICLEGSSHSKHRTRPHCTARHFHSSGKCLGRGMGAKPGQSLHPRGSQAKLERRGAVRRGQDCHWLWRRGESRPPSRDVRVGSRRVLRGHNSFLQTGNTVKHKTQTKKERERKKAGGKRAERGREEKTDATTDTFPPPSVHIRLIPSRLSQLPRHGVKVEKD